MNHTRKVRAQGSETPRNHVTLIVLDGWGIAPKSKYNAVSLARTPNLDLIKKDFGATPICASGQCVGLSKGQMGNSEVGHLTIGAGRVIFQDLMRVNEEIRSGRLEKNKALVKTMKRISEKNRGQTLHLIGLVSDGGVHSHIEHLFSVLKIGKKYNVKDIAVHVILDGRDTPPKSGLEFIETLLSFMKKIGAGYIATISGRYYAMDRDNRWDRTKLAYDAIGNGKAKKSNNDPLKAVQTSYSSGVTDEFVQPIVIGNYKGVKDREAIFFFNFRPDRARQLTKAFVQSSREFQDKFDRKRFVQNLDFLTMTIYDTQLKNVKSILGREFVSDTLSNVLEKNNVRQLRIAETEKYAHVTYFFNGLNEAPKRQEDRILVPSAREVGTYDKKPEMSAGEITLNTVNALRSGRYGFILVNYANADMVGHSGNIRATVKAIETVDTSIGKIYEAWKEMGKDDTQTDIFITADHGNSEKMYDVKTKQPHTAHTSNLVPLILISKKWIINMKKNYKPGLIDIAPSILDVLGLKKPASMTGASLVKKLN